MSEEPIAQDAPFLWAIIESLPQAILAVTKSGELRLINTAAKRLLGTDREEMSGTAVNNIVRLLDGRTHAPISRPLEYIFSASSHGRLGIYDIVVRPDGSEVPVEFSLRKIDGTGGDVLIVLRDASRTRDIVRRLNVRATHDALTRLLNRAEFERRLARSLADMKSGQQHALLYLDIDGFKHINDTYGHNAGDATLRHVARVLRAHLREGDTLARLGGDEFALLLEHCSAETASHIARMLGAAIETHTVPIDGKRIPANASIGAIAIADGRRQVHDVLAEADRACYSVKRARKAAYVVMAPAYLPVRQSLFG